MLARLPLALLLSCVLVVSAARAEDNLVVVHQGRLLDSADQPVSGEVKLSFSIYPVATNPDPSSPVAPLWSGTFEGVTVTQAGTFGVLLGGGAGQPLPASVFSDGAPRWLSVKVNDSAELLPRLRIGSVPVAAFSSRATVAADAEALEGHDAAYFTDAANLTGTLGAAVLYAGQPIADAQIAGAAKWNANLAEVALDETSPLTGKGTAGEPLTIGPAGASANGYLRGEDFARFEAKVSSVSVGAGLTVTGSATEPKLELAFGSATGTVTQGNDPRLSDARAPTAGSPHYIQNLATDAEPQDAHLSVKSAAIAGSLTVGGVNVFDGFPFYRMTINQALNGTTNAINGWSVNTAQGASVTFFDVIPSDVVWENRPAAHRELLTAMGREGIQHLRYPIRIYRMSWTQQSKWIAFPNQISTLPHYTAAAFTKLESGQVSGFWAEGAASTWKLTGTNHSNSPEGYSHPHPYSGSVTGSMLVAMPAVVAGWVDLENPRNWSWFPYVDSDPTK